MIKGKNKGGLYTLNLTSKNAVAILSSLASTIESNYQKCGANVFIELVEGYSAMDSVMRYSFDKKAKIAIGIDDIIERNALQKISDKKLVKNADFVRTLVAFFHENRHARNVITGFHACRDNKKDDYYIAINCLACKENLDYYTLNYNSSPYEIDAEQAAIMSTYLFLRKEFQDSQYEQLILNYVNDRCAEGNYKIKPIKDGYKSIKDVDIAFNQAFEKSKFDERFFDIQSSDEISMFLKDNENWLDVERKIEKMNELNEDFDAIGFKRDEMLASVTLYLHPECQNKIYAIQNDILSPKNVFGITSFPLRDDYYFEKYDNYDEERG